MSRVGYLALAGLAAPLVLLARWPGGYLPLVWVAGAMFACLLGSEWRRIGHPLTPAGIVAVGGLLLFWLRPLSIAVLGTTTAGAAAQTRSFAGPTVLAGRNAIIQVILFFLAFGACYFRPRTRPRPHRRRCVRRPDGPPADAQLRAAATCVRAAMLVAAACVGYLVVHAGGLRPYLSGVAFRAAFFAGHFYLTLGYLPLEVALCLYVLLRRQRPGLQVWTPLAVGAAACLLLSAFATGGRGPLILGAAVPLLVLKQLGPRRLRVAGLAACTLGLAVVALLMSLLLRSNVYDRGATVRALRHDPGTTLLTAVTNGSETRPFDSLVLLDEQAMAHELPYRHGATYLKALTWFVPHALDPGKDNGANAWFTRRYLPDFYYPDHVETSLSAVGEAFANFGWLGVAVAGGVLGLGTVRADPRSASVPHRLRYVVLTPLYFSLLRGDAFGNVALLVLTLGLTSGCWWLCSGGVRWN